MSARSSFLVGNPDQDPMRDKPLRYASAGAWCRCDGAVARTWRSLTFIFTYVHVTTMGCTDREWDQHECAPLRGARLALATEHELKILTDGLGTGPGKPLSCLFDKIRQPSHLLAEKAVWTWWGLRWYGGYYTSRLLTLADKIQVICR